MLTFDLSSMVRQDGGSDANVRKSGPPRSVSALTATQPNEDSKNAKVNISEQRCQSVITQGWKIWDV